jgi:hypothetical protein
MIAEAEVTLASLAQNQARFRAMKEPSPFIKNMMDRNEATMAEWERRLGELNRCMMTRKFLELSGEPVRQRGD